MKNAPPPIELLDDIYSTGDHEQRAYDFLNDMQQPKGGFTWTGSPRASFDYYSRNFARIIDNIFTRISWPLLFFCFYIFIKVSSALQLPFGWIEVLFCLPIIAPLGIVVLLVWMEWDRRNTYYGISQDTIWVKRGTGSLKPYKMATLPRLTCSKNTIFYSTIIDNTYTKHALLQDIPRASMVYELIQASQQQLHKHS